MKKFLTRVLIDELKTDTLELLEEAEKLYLPLSAAQLLQPMPGGGWSIAQVMDHLNGYGRFYLPQMEHALEKGVLQKEVVAQKEFRSGWLGNYFTEMMKPAPAGKPMKKMKAMKGHIPPVDLPAFEVRDEFFRQLRRLLYLLDRSFTTDIGYWRIPISIAPFLKLKLGDVFRFITAHNARHGKQMKRAFTHLHKDPAIHPAGPLPPSSVRG